MIKNLNSCFMLMIFLLVTGCMSSDPTGTPVPPQKSQFEKMWEKQLPHDRKYEEMQRQGLPPSKRDVWENRPKNFPRSKAF
jgi:hypothetical protein